jgi:ribose transport system substrate-binding protein
MNRRRTCAAAAAVLMALSLSACNRGSQAPDAAGEQGGCGGATLGLAVANLNANFFNQIKQSVETEAQKVGATVQVSDAGGDSATQVNQIQDFITRSVKAIIYIPAGATAASVPVKAAERANIPVVNVDRNAPDAPGKTFIASDSVAAANTLGNWVVEQRKGQGNVAIIQGQIGTTPQVDRQKGFEAALAEAPGMKVVAQQSSEWDPDKSFRIAQDMIQANPNIDVFFGQSDQIALGAVQAVEGANLNPRPIVVGFDGDPAGLQAVKDGKLNATMVQQTQLMGRLAVQSSCDIIAGKEVPPQQLQEAFLVTTADNQKLDEYLATHP